ncbi:MAG: SAM-dependent methyltransferase [Fimbriimonadales bacterium]|nr:MAG: SAM-dependent methyltransferase [Fimbriimonadales bacterium]
MPKRLSMADLSREQLIQRYAQRLKGVLDEIVPQSPNESDFRYRVNRVLDDFCEKLGFEIELRTEYGLAGKRADSVFNRFVVEYKRPGELGDSLAHPKTSKAVEQLKEYLRKLARDERQDLARIAGVVFDGCFLVFVRYRDGNFAVERPVPATQATLERLLTWLSSTASGIALTAENLTRDFGIEQPRTQRILRALYGGLTTALQPNANDNPTNPMVNNLFRQWQVFFSQSIDYSEAFGGRKLQPLQKWARKAGIAIRSADEAERLFFVMHTHFALLAKLLGYLAVSRLLAPGVGASPLGSWLGDSNTLQQRLHDLESGGVFRQLGIVNLLEGDFFAWYLYAWNNHIERALRGILQRLDEYDPTTLALVPEETRDLFKQLYHYLLPREIRHNLGEYYTPDWLALHLLQRTAPELFETPTPECESQLRQRVLNTRFLDPACGSGTFLVLLIARLRGLGRALPIDERDLLNAILQNVVGFDLNPLAVLTARVNYLLAIADLLPHRKRDIVLPVYLADSIRTPAQGHDLYSHDAYTFPTAVGAFEIPAALCRVSVFDRFCDLLEACVNSDTLPDAFVQRVERELAPADWNAEDAARIKQTYERLRELHAQGLNGLWARLLKNNFAPLTVGQFDYIVGNPPWINWEHLPDSYRNATKDLWTRYQLAGTYKGGRPRLGAVKVDISTLMTYVVADALLKDGGNLGFVITQSVFKTAAGAGFRRFELPEQNKQRRPLKVLHVDDMVELLPFEAASNRTAVLVLQKGQPTCYHVPYTVWRKVEGARFSYDSTLDEVLAATQRHDWHAEPVDPRDSTSQWLTAHPAALNAIRKVLGKACYKAHAGVCTWLNPVYWVQKTYTHPNGDVVVQNITEGAKVKVGQVSMTVEPDLLYPLLRGRDVQRWHAQPSAWIIVPQDPNRPSRAYPEASLQVDYPKTYAYLKRFEKELRNRSGYKQILSRRGQEFYGLMDIDHYTFAPWKVVWTRIGRIQAAVVSSSAGKVVIPQETITLVPCDSPEEAHYICAIVNSAVFQFAAESYSQKGGKSMGTMHLLDHIHIPCYDPNNPVHRELADLSRQAHVIVARGDTARLGQVEKKIDELAAQVWGLTESEMDAIRQSLQTTDSDENNDLDS